MREAAESIMMAQSMTIGAEGVLAAGQDNCCTSFIILLFTLSVWSCILEAPSLNVLTLYQLFACRCFQSWSNLLADAVMLKSFAVLSYISLCYRAGHASFMLMHLSHDLQDAPICQLLKIHNRSCSAQGTCLEEAARIEEFFDTARARVEWLSSRQEITERRFTNHGVPWDRSVFKATRHASLHLAVIYMSRYSINLGLVHSMACRFSIAA